MPYRMNIQEVVQETYSDLDKGLSEQEAAARLRDQGKNELLKKKKETLSLHAKADTAGSLQLQDPSALWNLRQSARLQMQGR